MTTAKREVWQYNIRKSGAERSQDNRKRAILTSATIQDLVLPSFQAGSTPSIAPTPPSDVGACHATQAVGSALMRADSRESLRAAVLRWITPLEAARCISGCAARNASAAAARSPPAIAASTFLTNVRTRDLRVRLRSVRRSVWRIRFRADALLAMGSLQNIWCRNAGRDLFPRFNPGPVFGDQCDKHCPRGSQATPPALSVGRNSRGVSR
jgi:hypothetical protein